MSAPFPSPPEAPSAPGPASPAPVVSTPLAGLDELPLTRRSHLADADRAPPDAVLRELEHMQKHYALLPALRTLPDFLSVNDVLALLPETWRESTRPELHAQLAEGNREVVYGDYLDDEQRFFVLWVTTGLEQAMVVYDEKGNVTSRHEISRGMPYLVDVPGIDPNGTSGAREVVLVRITSMSACCLPRDLEVYALGRQGKLRRVFSFEKDHALVGPGVHYYFMNHVEFSADGGAVVTRVYPEENQGRWEFRYRSSSNRYEATPQTSRAIRERRAVEKSQLEGPGLDVR